MDNAYTINVLTLKIFVVVVVVAVVGFGNTESSQIGSALCSGSFLNRAFVHIHKSDNSHMYAKYHMYDICFVHGLSCVKHEVRNVIYMPIAIRIPFDVFMRSR